jgi:dihydrolipoamide dehydrogenase
MIRSPSKPDTAQFPEKGMVIIMENLDLIVIGGGPAGYLAAQRAAQGGLSVALFEKRSLGGTCLNEGCIPTKSLLYSAKMYRHALHSAPYGITAENVSLNHGNVLKHKNRTVKMLVSGVDAQLKAAKVSVIHAEAVIAGRSDGGFLVEAGAVLYEGSRILIAAGSEAVVPPVPGIMEGLSSGFVMTNREILDRPELPKHLVVIGGGCDRP